ncbi:MAG: phospholipid carrier-dependent glycosyltransferase [Sedimentisphaerales bacterium]
MRKSGLLLIGFFLLVYVLPLGVRPMVIPDESRYAEISREMLETGGWVVPHLNGLRYFEKPILGHWLHALSIKLMGANAFAIRLPSALSVGLSALMLFLLVCRFTSDTTAAIMAAFVFLTCLEVFCVGTFCVLDSIFSMFIAASIIASFFAFIETRPLKRTIFLVSAGIACGFAFLAKGFLAFVIPTIVIVPFAIWQHQLKELLRFFWLPVIAAVLTALPWGIMIHLKEPDFWHYFFWVEHINRFISPNGGQHPYPFWFYIPVILGGTLPWTTQISGVIYRLRKNLSNDPLLRFSICWFLFPFLFFSICRGKLETYILPCFPPLIVLFTVGLRQEWKTVTAERFNCSDKIGVILIITLSIALVLTQTIISKTKIYRPHEIWKLLFISAGLLAYAVFLIQAGISTNHARKFFFSCMAPIMLIFSAQFVVPDKLIEKKAPIDFLSRYKNRISQNTILVSDNYLTPAVCWSYKRSDVLLLNNAGELTYGLGYDDSSKHRLLDIEQLRELITKDLGKEHAILITSTKQYMEYKQQLPKPVFENIDCGFVFVEFAAKRT